MRRLAVMIIAVALVLSLVPTVFAEQCYRWSPTASRWDPAPTLSEEECRRSTFQTQWTDERPTEPPPRPPGETAPSEPAEGPAPTSTRSGAPPEDTTLYTDEGFFIYQGGRWSYVEGGETRELSSEQQERLNQAWSDPEQRGRFTVPEEEGSAPGMTFTSEEAESPPRGTTYTGPTGTYRDVPPGASDEEIAALIERCGQRVSGAGQCHRDGNQIRIGPRERGRGGDGGASAPERGSGTEIRFYPPVDDERPTDELVVSGRTYTRREDGKWGYTSADGRWIEVSGDESRRLEEQRRQQQEENLEMRRAACQEDNAGLCTTSGDQVIAPREAGERVGLYSRHRPGSPELAAAVEQCNGAHGNRCWSDDRGNIQYRMSDDEQPHDYWIYNGATGQIERTTEGGCTASGGDPSRTCCTDNQENCQRARQNHQNALEQARMQTMWEGKEAVRGWIKILQAFGVSDEWDREIFQDFIQWAQTKAGRAITGHWEESICMYTPDFNQPTGMIDMTGSGQFGTWIKGARTVTSKVNESDPQRAGRLQKLYKITGSVMPRGLTVNSGKVDSEGKSTCTDNIKFRILLDGEVVDMLGDPGTSDDFIQKNCDSDPFEFHGQAALHYVDTRTFNEVCIQFEGTPLLPRIAEQLRDGRFCTRIVEAGDPAGFGCPVDFWGNMDCSAIPELSPEEADAIHKTERGEHIPPPRHPSEEI